MANLKMVKRFSKQTRDLIVKFLYDRDGNTCIGCNNNLDGREKIDIAHIDEDPTNNNPENLRLMHHSCNQKARSDLVRKLGKTTAGVSREREIINTQLGCNDNANDIILEKNYEYETTFRRYAFSRVLGASRHNERVSRDL